MATVVEQLDLALEHIAKGDVHNARFGLMLTDNAIELVLHQIAKDKASDLKSFFWREKDYPHQIALDKALGRSFEHKIKFAKLEANLSDELAQTINTMHEYRNEVYHVGLRHETILPALARFYFDIACAYLATYQVKFFGWSSNQKIPGRAQKHFKGDGFFPGEREDFSSACLQMAVTNDHDPAATIAVLAAHFDEAVNNTDTCVRIVADGVYEGQQRTRDQAVVETQAWSIAFAENGRAFAAERNFAGSVLQLIDWLGTNYPFPTKKDPIPSWRGRAETLRSQKNAHRALAQYQSFMIETAPLRETLEESAAAAEAEIDAAIDRARGK